MKTVKLNKNGLPRKAGSGRTKGSISLVSVKMSDLKKLLGDDDRVTVGRLFLVGLGASPTLWGGTPQPEPVAAQPVVTVPVADALVAPPVGSGDGQPIPDAPIEGVRLVDLNAEQE